MTYVIYKDMRNNVSSGDLLIWEDSEESLVSRIILKCIRLFTKQQYGHVGIAWRVGGRLLCVEAVPSGIRIWPVSEFDRFFYVETGMTFKDKDADWLLDKVGQPYPLNSLFRSIFKLQPKVGDNLNCVELSTRFYQQAGYQIGDTYTPGDLVERFVNDFKCPLTLIDHI